jgi:GNAT superfamily N-acetyltransferase
MFLVSVQYQYKYIPGALATLCAMQTRYYAHDWGFDHRYEAVVSAGIAEFLPRYNPKRDLILLALRRGEIAGGIVIDGGGEGSQSARLRWYIVSKELRGTGVGRILIQKAMEFVRERKYENVFLTTFHGLDPARRLYEKAGFLLVEESEKSTWGKAVMQQRFEFITP